MDAGGNVFIEAGLTGDVGTAFAALGNQLGCPLLALAREFQQTPQAVSEAAPRPGMVDHEAWDLGGVFGVDEFEILLGGAIVAGVQLKQPGRVGTAVGILEQQRVVQASELVGRHAQGLSHMHPDPA